MAKRRPSGDGMARKRKDGRWEGRIVVGHKADGSSIFRYLYADTQKELTARLRQSIDAYQGVDLTEDSRMTLSEWLDQWLERRMAGTVRPNTLEGYRRDMDRHVKPYLGGKLLAKVTADDLSGLYRTLLERGRTVVREGGGPGLSPATVRGIHATLHHAFEAAVEEGLIPFDPADHAAAPRVERAPRAVLNSEQLERFREAADRDPIWRDFFRTELTTGLRRGELCGLRWEDFDSEAGTLKVRRTIHVRKGGVLEVGDTKTYAGHRMILLPHSTAQLLRERKESALTEWIFPDPLRPEQPVNPGSAYRRLKTLLEQAGLPGIRFHDLRHTFATHALSGGVDAKTLSGILGHTKASFTLDAYTHVTGDMHRSAAEIVGNVVTEWLGGDLTVWQNEGNGATAAST